MLFTLSLPVRRISPCASWVSRLILILFGLAVSAVDTLAQTPARNLGEQPQVPGLRDDRAARTIISQPAADQPYAWWETPAEGSQEIGRLEDMVPSRWTLGASLSAGYEYDDNLRLSDNNEDGSGFFTLQPHVHLKYGPMASGLAITAGYGADFQWYSEDGVKDSVNHAADLGFTWTGGRLQIYGNIGFASIDDASIDAGARVERQTVVASLGLTYDITGKTTLGITYATDLFNPESDGYSGYNSQTVGASIDYDITGKTTLGVGTQYEFEEVEQGSDRNAYRVLLRANWAATPKLTVRGEAGPEINEYSDGDSELEAYWNIGIDYKLLDTGKTTFAFDVYRNQTPSIVMPDQAYSSTGIAGTLTYNPASRLQIYTSVGYEYADYTGTSTEIVADREDNLYFIRPGLTYAINRWSSVSIFYQWTKNSSSGIEQAPFERNNYGVLLNLIY
jgi:hypothetical protein